MKQIIDETGTLSMPAGGAKLKSSRQDDLNRNGAMALAQRLEKYWHDRGYFAARFWAEPIDERFAKIGTHEIYRVKCNLVNGMPPRYGRRPH